MTKFISIVCVLALSLGLYSCSTPVNQKGSGGGDLALSADMREIEHVVVIYQENWSFDGLYGKFQGVNGLSNAAASHQVDKNGTLLQILPQIIDTDVNPPVPDKRFPPTNGGPSLPAEPYDFTKYVPPNERTGDLIHRFYHEQLQIDGGRMDKFVAWSDNGGLVLSYIDASALPEGKLAREYVLCDNFFHSGFGGSFFNHQFFIAAAPPRWENAPASVKSDPDPNHFNDNIVTPDGYAVNTVLSVNGPHPNGSTSTSLFLPQQTNPTIGDRLTEKGVSWKWYSGGWNDAIAGHPDPLFQFHHQPFVYYERYKDGSNDRKEHLQDEVDFFQDLSKDNLPAVSIIKPLGPDNEHPGYAALLQGQQHVAKIVDAVYNSKYWKNSVIIITYDENGGRWDHVGPPVIDRFGPGTRVPTIIISPYAKRQFVDHTQYETVSILRFLELRFGLKPLSDRDAKAEPLRNSFNLRQ